MRWKGLIAVLIIVALLGGFIGVPVARAATIVMDTVGYGTATNGSGAGVAGVVITVRHLPASVVLGYQLTSVSHQGASGWSLSGTFNGHSVPLSGTVPFFNGSSTGDNYSLTFFAPNSWGANDATVDTWTIHCSFTGTFGANVWNVNINESRSELVVGGGGSWSAYVPLSVSITGSPTAAIGVNTLFAAVIVGGTVPYSTTWHVDGTGGNEGVLIDASNVSSAGLTLKFATISHYIVRCTVVDGIAGIASAMFDVNLMSAKPVMHGQIVRAEAAESYKFSMYTDGVVLPEGVVPEYDCVPSAQYEVTSPTVMMQSEYGYQIYGASPLPSPLYVYVTWHVPDTGEVWSYRFTMDTTVLTGAGTWIKSDGTGSDDGAVIAPTWVDGVLNKLKTLLIDTTKTAFQWLFVPNPAQMALLMPQGTVQADGTLSKEGNIAASLLEGTTWGAGASEWKLEVHYSGMTIRLVDIDFTGMRNSAFVKGLRLAIQGVMSMSLIYLIVVLI